MVLQTDASDAQHNKCIRSKSAGVSPKRVDCHIPVLRYFETPEGVLSSAESALFSVAERSDARLRRTAVPLWHLDALFLLLNEQPEGPPCKTDK